MDIHHLKVFVAVFRGRSFSGASESLRLTQPTISSHIKALEEELQCSLFDRMGRSIIPTKEAELLYPHAVEIIERAEGVKEIIGSSRNEIAGSLFIGASTIPGTYILPSIMAEMQKSHSSLSFQITIADSKEILERIARHEILLGIVGARLSEPAIRYIPFREDELIIVASPSMRAPEVMEAKAVTRFPLVMREEGSGTRKETERILAHKGIAIDNIRPACVLSSPDAIKQAVKAGMGIAILSRVSVADEIRCGVLREISLKGGEMKRAFYIATHKKRSLPPTYRFFLDYLTAWSGRQE
ncbi:MAG: selenium metabolism-associated LysR family transcriptional regulator [Thermodesulfovibrionales bacterium]|jgi:DNA-binding transcriptional LysR family regulator